MRDCWPNRLKLTRQIMWKIICLVFIFPALCQSNYTRISSKPSSIIFKYLEGTTGELTLDECGKDQVCNVVHRRFWMPNLAERLCRCPNGEECPWSEETDNSSIVLNNRSILKFCQPITEKQVCKPRQIAAVVRGVINDENTHMIPQNVTVNCICPSTHYWRLKKYEFDENRLYQAYKCSQQRICYSYEFCGFVRSDFYSIYYRCSCPKGNLCITEYKESDQVQEFMYLGTAYKAHCDPWNKTSRIY
ncbi:kappa-scoloptoxin(11)-Ssd1b-like [Cotesia glomerata]|uniref:kappa-scoloptoxin(11)-Ssd1b-like n=1 Tax=Cotesia glomerata TaxID=32391 RepID=UPI001D01E093|nr:kappa-scoloptoxin(11)-Ssd1b-like [Cotesia glomerata]